MYFDEDSGVRLRVGAGCLSEGQTAGPISVITHKRYIVKSGDSSYLVSAVVDCQPSGAIFKSPLSLQFCVGEGEEGSESSDGEDEDSDSSDGEDAKEDKDSDESRQDDQGRQEYLNRLNSTYKVTWEINTCNSVPPAVVCGNHVLEIVPPMILEIPCSTNLQ